MARETNIKGPTRNRIRIVAGLILGSLTLSLLLGCGAALAPAPQLRESMVEAPAVSDASMKAAYQTAAELVLSERLIIRSGNISMVVEDTRASRAAIESMVAAMAGEGAFVISSEERSTGGEGAPYIVMSIRVPSTRFDEAMDRLAEMAVRVTNRSESGQDVTEEYVDLKARLESLEAARQRLLGIMAEARTTKDLLEAEQQLTQREAEIESIKGRMQYLEQSARLSSIWIELQPFILSQPVGERWRPAETARRALETLMSGLRGFGNLAIFFAIAVLPWLIGMGLGIYVVVRFFRWRLRAGRKQSSD
jgi:hypothetical protein